ncbi:hypothetical protein D3C72_1937680 [compost metagenome]
MQFFSGVGVLAAAKPAPMAGWIANRGMTTVAMPTSSAGSRLGLRAQSMPTMPSSRPAKAMPVT